MQLNKLLRRTNKQYSATHKTIRKLKELNIVYTIPVPDSKRKAEAVYINKEIAMVYGEDEFRQMMLNEWDSDAKEYIERTVSCLRRDKVEFEKKIKKIKKGKGWRNGKGQFSDTGRMFDKTIE